MNEEQEQEPGQSRWETLARLSRAAVSVGANAALLPRYIEGAVEATKATRGFIALAEAESGGLALGPTAGADWNDINRNDRLSDRQSANTLTGQVARHRNRDPATAILRRNCRFIRLFSLM